MRLGPFSMIRPNELSTSDADYIVVHGIVTAEGRFDQLALVFPEDLAQKDLLMSSLKRWEFRPASQAGQNAAVEVLLDYSAGTGIAILTGPGQPAGR